MIISCIIPARMQSSRFYGKPLAIVGNVPMIQKVYDNAVKANIFDEVFVATGDQEIGTAVKGKVLMTKQNHLTCTDRVSEAAEYINADIVVNLQGDEPLLEPDVINSFVRASAAVSYATTTAYCDMPVGEQDNPNRVKAVIENNLLIDLKRNSRSPYKQIGLYAYNYEKIINYRFLPNDGSTELDSKRFITNNIDVGAIKIITNSLSVDTLEDLKAVNLRL